MFGLPVFTSETELQANTSKHSCLQAQQEYTRASKLIHEFSPREDMLCTYLVQYVFLVLMFVFSVLCVYFHVSVCTSRLCVYLQLLNEEKP